MQQVFTLWSLLRCSSKLRSRKAPKLVALQGLVAASSHAPELAAATQQALMLQSLVLQRNKLSRSGACCVAGFSCSKQAPEFSELRRSFGAWLPLQTKQTKKN